MEGTERGLRGVRWAATSGAECVNHQTQFVDDEMTLEARLQNGAGCKLAVLMYDLDVNNGGLAKTRVQEGAFFIMAGATPNG